MDKTRLIIERVLTGYSPLHSDGLLADLLTPDGDQTVDRGLEEIAALAEAIARALDQ